jgi:hypothetical protein
MIIKIGGITLKFNDEPQIRILPLNKALEYGNKHYLTIQQELFLDKLKNNHGNFHFYSKKSKMKAPAGSLVLFQYGTEIIASANIIDTIVFDIPHGKYDGTYVFDTNSIRIFYPIVFSELPMIKSAVGHFSQARHNISIEYTEYIENLIKSRLIL